MPSIRTGRGIYDCLCLALAALLNAAVVTADRKFIEGVSGSPFSHHVLWIEDVLP